MHTAQITLFHLELAYKDNLASKIEMVKELASILGDKSMTSAGRTGSNKDVNELDKESERAKLKVQSKDHFLKDLSSELE